MPPSTPKAEDRWGVFPQGKQEEHVHIMPCFPDGTTSHAQSLLCWCNPTRTDRVLWVHHKPN